MSSSSSHGGWPRAMEGPEPFSSFPFSSFPLEHVVATWLAEFACSSGFALEVRELPSNAGMPSKIISGAFFILG